VALFNPSRDEVRQFFCEAWQKHINQSVLTPLETLACKWIEQHPEYHSTLNHPDKVLQQEFTPEQGTSNQISINQPPGIQVIAQQLSNKLDSEHEMHHQIMECLGKALWDAQRSGQMLDTKSYLECIRKLF
jgi:hypothetical protein